MALDNLNIIEKLLDKYDNGQTSLQEEQQLRDYFSQDQVAPHLEPYRAMFCYFAGTKQETFTKDVPVQAPKRSYVYQWIAAAAVAIIMLGIFMQFDNKNSKGFDGLTGDEQLVYDQTKEAFELLSSKFNENASSVSALGVVGSHFDKGIEKAKYVNEFSKTTDKILNKPKK